MLQIEKIFLEWTWGSTVNFNSVYKMTSHPVCEIQQTKWMNLNSEIIFEQVTFLGFFAHALQATNIESFVHSWKRKSSPKIPFFFTCCPVYYFLQEGHKVYFIDACAAKNTFSDPRVGKKSCSIREKHLYFLVAQYTINYKKFSSVLTNIFLWNLRTFLWIKETFLGCPVKEKMSLNFKKLILRTHWDTSRDF